MVVVVTPDSMFALRRAVLPARAAFRGSRTLSSTVPRLSVPEPIITGAFLRRFSRRGVDVEQSADAVPGAPQDKEERREKCPLIWTKRRDWSDSSS